MAGLEFDICATYMYIQTRQHHHRSKRFSVSWCRCPTWTLSSQGLTALKLSSTVTSYITTTPSAFRKNCLVMLRYLFQRHTDDVSEQKLIKCNNVSLRIRSNTDAADPQDSRFICLVQRPTTIYKKKKKAEILQEFIITPIVCSLVTVCHQIQ